MSARPKTSTLMRSCHVPCMLRLRPTPALCGSTSDPRALQDGAAPRKRATRPAKNIVWSRGHVTANQRATNMGQKGACLWFTGLSGSGKSTVAIQLEKELVEQGHHVYRLDGDNIRYGLSRDLGFSDEDRMEHNRRVSEVARLMADAGMIVLVSFISPFRADRQVVRSAFKQMDPPLPFMEVYVNVDLATAEKRDPKGLYKKARTGELKAMTGISSPYEAPLKPEIELRTDKQTVEESSAQIMKHLKEHKILITNKKVGAIAPSSSCPKCKACSSAATASAECKPCSATAATACKTGPPVWDGKGLTPPDGGEVVDLVVPDKDLATKVAEAKTLPTLEITKLDLQWLQVLADGWASPLRGFMNETQFLSCIHFNTLYLPSGEEVSQSVPIVLAMTTADKERIGAAKSVTLNYDGKPVAIMRAPEIYSHRRTERAGRTWGVTEPGIPYIGMIMKMGEWLIGGELEVLGRIKFNDGLDKYRMTPKELRAEFKKRNADAVFAFQLRNPVHNGHALLMTTTREKLLKQGYKNPVLLLHPLGGWTKADDVPLDVRMAQHHAVIKAKALDPDSTVLAIWPSPMSYSGPNEVQWHAKSRINAGVTHYIVGRDPAGMKSTVWKDDLYESSHGVKVLNIAPGLKKLKLVGFRPASYDKTTGKMAFIDMTRKKDFISISGSKMRKFGREGKDPPAGFMVPEAWKIVKAYFASVAKTKAAAPAAAAAVAVAAAAPAAAAAVPAVAAVAAVAVAAPAGVDVATLSTKTEGEMGTMAYKLFFQSGGKLVSPWHDVPLQSGANFNMVCEIPLGTSAKMEIDTKARPTVPPPVPLAAAAANVLSASREHVGVVPAQNTFRLLFLFLSIAHTCRRSTTTSTRTPRRACCAATSTKEARPSSTTARCRRRGRTRRRSSRKPRRRATTIPWMCWSWAQRRAHTAA